MSFEPRCQETIMICALPRSGSNLLCELLAKTRRLGNPDEWLNQDRIQWNCSTFGLPADASVEDLIAALQEKTQTLNGVFAHKILRYSYDYLIAELGRITDNAGLSERELLEKYFPGLRLLYIDRGDTLKQAVSLLKASQSALWHNNNRKTHRVHPVHFSYTQLDSILKDLSRQEAAWNHFFEESGMPVMKIKYEDLIADPDDTMQQVVDFLGMEGVWGGAGARDPSHKPTSNHLNEAWRQRFEQLRPQVEEAPADLNMDPDLRKAEISTDRDSLEVVAGELVQQKVKIRNTSPLPWLPYGQGNGSGWIKVACQILDTNNKPLTDSSTWHELPTTVPPGETCEIEIIQKAPEKAGEYTIWVDCVVTPNHWFHRNCGCGFGVPLTVEMTDEQRHLESYLGDLVQQDSLVLFKSDWFGSFHALKYPTIHHYGLGPMELKGPGIREDQFIVQTEYHGILRFSSKEFPVVWSEKAGAYLKWHRGTHNPPKLSILKGDTWMPYNFKEAGEAVERARVYFGQDIPEDGRVEISWFGLIDVSSFPRIFHEKFGLVWCSGPGAAEDSFFFQNAEKGWMWTSPEAYPHVRLMKQKRWVLAEELAKTDF